MAKNKPHILRARNHFTLGVPVMFKLFVQNLEDGFSVVILEANRQFIWDNPPQVDDYGDFLIITSTPRLNNNFAPSHRHRHFDTGGDGTTTILVTNPDPPPNGTPDPDPPVVYTTYADPA